MRFSRNPAEKRRLVTRATDAVARLFITSGGILMIVSLALIFVLIVSESLPLWKGARITAEKSLSTAAGALPVLASSQNEYREAGELLRSDGTFTVLDLRSGKPIREIALPELAGTSVSAVSRSLTGGDALGLADGTLLFVTRRWSTSFEGGTRAVDLAVRAGKSLSLDPLGRPPRLVGGACKESGACVAVSSPAPEVLLYGTLSDDDGPKTRDLSATLEGERLTVLALNDSGETLVAGTESGSVLFWSFLDADEPMKTDVAKLSGERITAVHWLLGGQTAIVGDAKGSLKGFAPVRKSPEDQKKSFLPIHSFEPLSSAVSLLATSPRSRAFLAADAEGKVTAYFATNERVLGRFEAGAKVVSLAFSPKQDGLLVQTERELRTFTFDAPHPEISLRALFGDVWYEGSDQPEKIWQSTGGTDDFEAKLSLVPLLFGTMKGTVYALLIAIPIALSAALYTAAFARPELKAIVKPVVEIMAALPSVVIGFVAALWLSPLVDRNLLTTLVAFPLVPLTVLAGVVLYQMVPAERRRRLRPGRELFFVLPLVLLAIGLARLLGPFLESALFGGDFKQWLPDHAGLTYDARNCLVVGFAMGFAVIPIIFTISEDALSSVPGHLKAASLALGASPWQTAVRVILPTASPGIFSAVMVGFGRAVGETMIVLMATGNTPIWDLSIFNGMRALSANIAVEIPEAPHGGTLYRVLFFSALLLFLLTFVLNTVAELVRQRLRRKYSVI